MIVEKAWGSDLELSAISELFNVTIHLHTNSKTPEITFYKNDQIPLDI